MLLRSLLVAAITGAVQPAVAAETAALQNIVFFGDSITAGYGLEAGQAYTDIIQKKIEALKWPYRVVNAGVSGDTTAAGVDRLRWTLRSQTDILVLALGGNDGLRGVPPETTAANLQQMIDLAKKKSADTDIILAGMKMPPNYGPDYTRRFAAIYPRLARKNNVALVPFFLEGVGGIAELNLPDRIHPNKRGQEIIAETVWKTLKPILERRQLTN